MAMAPIPTPTIPIANLQPGLDADSTSVAGIVTLVWPYSSLAQSTSLLLVESDFRLRKHRGQVRIYFEGSSARAVARANISTGDRLLLSLKDSDWAKDATAATTPGKCIEWELRYGERVLLQVQHEGQEPTLLDIDHPPVSPKPASLSSIPRQSPPYNSHIATSARKSPPHADAWASPAFLKRTRFVASRHDPFLDEEDEFPDNDRRKRSKFGPGSGQWRFADRTPSLEKEPETDIFEIETPSRPDATQANAISLELQSSQRGGLENLPEAKRQHSPEHVEEVDGKIPEVAPPSPPSTTVNFSEDEGSSQPLQELQADTSSPRLVSSVAVSPELHQESESQPETDSDSQMSNSDDALFSGPASDFGLDGSALSRFKEVPENVSPMNAAIDELDQTEADTAHQDSPEDTISSPREPFTNRQNEEVTVIKESAHDFQFLGDQISTDSGNLRDEKQAAKQFQSDPMVTADELESYQGENESFIGISQVSSDAEPEDFVEELAMEEEEGDEEAKSHLGEVSLAERSLGETLTETKELPRQDELQAPLVKSAINREEGTKASLGLGRFEQQAEVGFQERTPNTAAENDVGLVVRKATKVEIINLESDDDEVEQLKQPNLHPPDRPPSVPSDGVATQEPNYRSPSPGVSTESIMNEVSESASDGVSLGDVEQITLRAEPGAEQRSPEQESPSSKPQGEMVLAPDEQRESSPRAPDAEIMPKHQPDADFEKSEQGKESPSLEPQKGGLATDEQVSRPQSPVAEGTVEPQPQPEIAKQSQGSSVEFLATVPDSAQEPVTQTQLLTPDIKQRTSFASQASFASLHNAPDDETMPTPQPSQSTSNVAAVPTAPVLRQKQSPVKEALPAEKEESKLEKKGPGEGLPEVKKEPTLVEKLKAIRRLSSQTHQTIGNVSAVSPWFAPKKSSVIVPDSEAGSEVESLSESDRRSSTLNGIANFQTPEKQKSLAKSFIRSPSQREGMTSIPSSPGYLPPSQPPPPGFRTSLSYFVPLATLQSHFNLSVDVLAIALDATNVTRATSGPSDYTQTIYLTDPSSTSLKTPTTTTQIFRSYNNCFPKIEKGDALLLREFKVQSFQRQLALISTHSSAWAVFRKNADIQIRGPPVELGAEERAFARGLWRWWDGSGPGLKERLDQAVVPRKTDRKMPPRNKPNVKVKKENQQPKGVVKKDAIEGLGVDLPGSQGSKSRKGSLKERSLDLDGVMESVEPPRRILRPRGARGMPEKSESPTKAINRRSGTVFTGGLGEPVPE